MQGLCDTKGLGLAGRGRRRTGHGVMMENWQGWLYVAAVLIPLGAFVVELLGGPWLKRLNAVIATLAIGTSCALSVVGFISYVGSAPGILSHAEHPSADVEHGSAGAHHAGPLAFRGSFDWVILGEGTIGKGSAPLVIPFGIHIDNLAAIMFVMVSFIATLIHVYSMGYMHDDPRYPLFFTYLSLFCFSMLGLVASANVFMIFMFWELVGVCSYLLIGFWYEEKKNADAANKAFVVNRVGDVGMLVGLGLLWSSLGTFNIDQINRGLRDADGRLNITAAPSGDEVVELMEVGTTPPRPAFVAGTTRPARIALWALTLAGLGIFAGCVGKSAQFPLHVWLPDAMAGPTPVSALIHAATMVAAGVYLVGRFFPVFTADVLLYIAYTGGITLFIAATIAMVQTDYKKVLAYSTVSQLGFMMLGLGVGGWAAGLFHLLTHAFFKALLFLGAGSVYHSVHTYEMPVLGGLRKKMPYTAYTMLAGTLAIAGVPFFSGFYSKDAILSNALFFVTRNPSHALLFILPAVGALITAFYMFRLWFLVFDGEPRGYPAAHAVAVESHGHAPDAGHDDHGAGHGHGHGHAAHGHGEHHGNPFDHAHESGPLMVWPLILLAIPAVFIGWPITLGLPFFGYEPVLEGLLVYGEPIRAVDIGGAKWWAMGGSVLIATSGIAAAAGYYSRWRIFNPEVAAKRFGGLYAFLVNKWYFDELYHAVLVRPTLQLARAVGQFDRYVIDGIVNGSAGLTVLVSKMEGFFDRFAVDGLVNLIAGIIYVLGDWGRSIQTGRLRTYLMVLALAVVVLFLGIFAWIRPTLAG
jgi:proton-translocating NADH-quinone oxidoreductase chain L